MNEYLNWDRILSASQKNNSTEIRRLVLNEDVNPNHANSVGQTASHVAALWGNSELNCKSEIRDLKVLSNAYRHIFYFMIILIDSMMLCRLTNT